MHIVKATGPVQMFLRLLETRNDGGSVSTAGVIELIAGALHWPTIEKTVEKHAAASETAAHCFIPLESVKERLS